MENAVILLVLAALLALAIRYIIKAKRRGQKCIGCPYAASCGKSAHGSCSCESERS